jgi:hypothetical protein
MPHALRKALQNYNKFFKFANFFVKKIFFLAFGIQHSACHPQGKGRAESTKIFQICKNLVEKFAYIRK